MQAFSQFVTDHPLFIFGCFILVLVLGAYALDILRDYLKS